MAKVYSEVDITWSSVESHYKYDKVVWSVSKDGIPRYALMSDEYGKINIGDYLNNV